LALFFGVSTGLVAAHGAGHIAGKAGFEHDFQRTVVGLRQRREFQGQAFEQGVDAGRGGFAQRAVGMNRRVNLGAELVQVFEDIKKREGKREGKCRRIRP
jgi:hypothetical protein